jgi:hypothetical protein
MDTASLVHHNLMRIVDRDTRHQSSRQGLILSRIYGTLRRIGRL